ncbi:MAG: chromosomal replication initiator protein DnaA, partial [Clostridia bacterium]|nr:chromosomal replication initiator protein DnaA [Clostridia bacterium]
RHIAIYIIREILSLSQPAIGKIFNRDHSTIISAYKGVEARLKNDSDFNKDLHEIKAELDEK